MTARGETKITRMLTGSSLSSLLTPWDSGGVKLWRGNDCEENKAICCGSIPTSDSAVSSGIDQCLLTPVCWSAPTAGKMFNSKQFGHRCIQEAMCGIESETPCHSRTCASGACMLPPHERCASADMQLLVAAARLTKQRKGVLFRRGC